MSACDRARWPASSVRAVAVLVIGVLALVGCAGSGRTPRTTPPPGLTLVTWNLQGSLLTGAALTEAAGYLRSTGADYVGLQEISVEQARAIAGQLGWGTDGGHVRVAFEHGGGNGRYAEGIAMLSRHPLEQYAETPIRPPGIPVHPEGRGRVLQSASITSDGTVYHLYNTHLASGDWSCRSCGAYVPGADDDLYREQQARFVRDTVERREQASAGTAVVYVVGGDMNSHPVPAGPPALAYRTLSARLLDTWAALHPRADSDPPCTVESGCTILIRSGRGVPQPPFRRVDYFFVDPRARHLLRSARTPAPRESVRYARYSDHFPYQLTIGDQPGAAG